MLRSSALAPAAFLPQAPRPRTSRPNILLLMADQWRADCLGAAGNRVIHTPNLDQLAAAGRPLHQRLFRHAHLHARRAPRCLPASRRGITACCAMPT